MICIFCGIEYIREWIQEKDKTRIKCPKKSCRIRIHENDIKALLDSENRALDIFLAQPQREWLQFKHDKDVIGYALGAPKYGKQCPLCMVRFSSLTKICPVFDINQKNFYAKIDGCNFVRCSNLRCNQWFCFCCGDPVQSWQHFSQGGQCRVSWDDVYKLTYLLRFIVFSDACTNFLLIPIAWLGIWIFLPLFVLIGFPYFSLRGILKLQFAAAIPLAILASPFIFATSVILFFGTFLTAFPLYFVYIIISVIKCIPPATHIFKVMDYAAKGAGIFGFGNWKQILMDSRDARFELEVEKMQIEYEKSEQIPTIERNEQQQLEYEAAELAREARQNRAVGAVQCAGGAVDVGRIIKKGAHNYEVVRKGEIQKVQFLGINDIKVNDAQAVAENIKIKGKAGKVVKLAAIV
uniref:Uncharacterized protein n=1 Tax=Panagrolaimus sp. PS1159 TaxID=55785 RepID=A0AC35FX86_9BILA